jgi:hypothetical protein
MQVRKTNYQVNATPKFQVLTEDEIEAIYYSALTVLYETGVRVYDEEGVQVAYEGGAIVEDALAGGQGAGYVAAQSGRYRPRPQVQDGAIQEHDLFWCGL